MNLHLNREYFSDAITATSQYMGISRAFVEKDYWITCMLGQIAEVSEFTHKVIFKGGTSLSKAYRIINRFSSDVDIAVITSDMSQGQVQKFIRRINKTVTVGLQEINTQDTKKGIYYRKTFHEYQSLQQAASTSDFLRNFIILEVTAFGNPYPFERATIRSFITEYMEANGYFNLIEQFGMQPFEMDVLDKRKTLCEKMVSLLRFSFADDAVLGLQQKIRHFYDLYYLMQNADCRKYVETDFTNDFNALVQHDKATLIVPDGWKDADVKLSPLLTSFDSMWTQLKSIYESELTQLSYRPIPPADEIKSIADELIKLIKK